MGRLKSSRRFPSTGEVTEMTPVETENPMGGYGKTVAHVIIGLKTAKGEDRKWKLSINGNGIFFARL